MLHYQTINETLRKVLVKLMSMPDFQEFRLVGGTALSLQLGHRISIDIDLFSDAPYGSLDFNSIENSLKNHFPSCTPFSDSPPSFGKSYSIGDSFEETVKLDIFYTDPFIESSLEVDSIRMASKDEIIAMKLEAICNGGRKKDFWDIHELLNSCPLNRMLDLHQQRYPFQHNRQAVISSLTHFEFAEDDFEPICLKGKIWEFIKEDIVDKVKGLQ